MTISAESGPAFATVSRFLAAVAARDAAAAGACFAPTATYANMPHPPVVGPAGVAGLLAPILNRSERVRWDLVSASYAADRAWLERVDRFWIDGREYAIECNGVAEIDPAAGLITAFRDYVDLATWRERLGDVLSSPAGPGAAGG
ncbi:nuclear transport factor 2 family protein [Sporichthya polymorpha]|uniref:nuclear transport factor 2 family protein n=1 Tax=Sporichthya polymorpha TaxID=35751 RepID=UPI000686D36A|nr:limonene-1,2-epoxide hydrolase family protein [Sporichthya polymorpha]